MASSYKVWLVDDLPKNRRDFEKNHASDFDITTFAKPSDVLSRILKKEYPDALLIDVYFSHQPAEVFLVVSQVVELRSVEVKYAACWEVGRVAGIENHVE